MSAARAVEGLPREVDREVRTGGTTGASRGLALGFLAMLPLFGVYEIARSSSGGMRNTAEAGASLALTPFGDGADLARCLLLGAGALAAAWSAYEPEFGLARRVGRIALEGLLGALLLGPILIALQRALDLPSIESLGGTPASAPRLADAGLHLGGAAWEELAFRVGLQSLVFLLAREVALFFTAHAGVARVGAEIAAIGLSSVVFAALHLAAFTRVLGPGGEPYVASIFAWRVLAGVLLAALFRWRGPGVAAWTHGLFNLALLVGAGPDVFL